MTYKINLLICFFLLSLVSSLPASEQNPRKPSEKDKCPVCGMFVYKYPEWIAEIIFHDGSVAYFDGAKDLFKYYLDPSKYAGGKTRRDISAIYVTEYYSGEMINGMISYYVVGSNVLGPMGNELVPFAKETEAKQFMKDHAGKKLMQFKDVTPAVIGSLD